MAFTAIFYNKYGFEVHHIRYVNVKTFEEVFEKVNWMMRNITSADHYKLIQTM